MIAMPNGLATLNTLHERTRDLLVADIVTPRIGVEVSRQAIRLNADFLVQFVNSFADLAVSVRDRMSDTKVLSSPCHLRDLVNYVEPILEQEVAQQLGA